MFATDVPVTQIAAVLRVSTKSVYQWRRWRAGGQAALASTGPGGATCRLSPDQLAGLRTELDRGPAAHGWRKDQRWTLARITTVIGRIGWEQTGSSTAQVTKGPAGDVQKRATRTGRRIARRTATSVSR